MAEFVGVPRETLLTERSHSRITERKFNIRIILGDVGRTKKSAPLPSLTAGKGWLAQKSGLSAIGM